jgi:hypothetical protein
MIRRNSTDSRRSPGAKPLLLAVGGLAAIGFAVGASAPLLAEPVVQEINTTVRGPIHEWRILADGTVLLKMDVRGSQDEITGPRWLRTPPDRSDKTSFENLVIESVLLCPHRADKDGPRFYARVEAERGQLGKTAENAMVIRSLGRRRVTTSPDGE